MTACTHDSNRLGAIREGACPRCELPMDRHEDHGRCACCGACWSAATDTVTVVVHAAVPARRSGAFWFDRGDLSMTFDG